MCVPSVWGQQILDDIPADRNPISPQPACLPVLGDGGRKVNTGVQAASVLTQINADAAAARSRLYEHGNGETGHQLQ